MHTDNKRKINVHYLNEIIRKHAALVPQGALPPSAEHHLNPGDDVTLLQRQLIVLLRHIIIFYYRLHTRKRHTELYLWANTAHLPHHTTSSIGFVADVTARSIDARRETMITRRKPSRGKLCESSREKSRSHASERHTRTRMYLHTSHDALCILVVLSRCVSVRTVPRGFRVLMHRNATQRDAMRRRVAENLGGSRVRLTAPRICHLGHLALAKAISGQRACARALSVVETVN